MKRTKMVDMMADQIFRITRELEEHPNYPKMTVREFNCALASRLLTFQITSGMAPPEVDGKVSVFDGIVSRTGGRQWEDE
jgi:hypothetical protein